MNRAVVLVFGLGLSCGLPTLAAGGTVVAAGYKHTTVVRTTDGTVWSWGANSSGQLGDGTLTDRETPVQVEGLAGIVAVASGAHHTLALASDGSVWSWGDDEFGQLGDTSTRRCSSRSPGSHVGEVYRTGG
jgi:alpha-tubulin suppressor-like RCC1 family protein